MRVARPTNIRKQGPAPVGAKDALPLSRVSCSTQLPMLQTVPVPDAVMVTLTTQLPSVAQSNHLAEPPQLESLLDESLLATELCALGVAT